MRMMGWDEEVDRGGDGMRRMEGVWDEEGGAG